MAHRQGDPAVWIPLPPTVPPSNPLIPGQIPTWKYDGVSMIPDNWPPGSYLDCCWYSNGVSVRAVQQAGHGVLTHNYGTNAPQWCDVFEVSCQPDRSWLPLENLGSTPSGRATAFTSATATDNMPNTLVAAAHSARTLQQRLDGAKAALRDGGPTAAIDARLLLTECLPGLTPAAKLKALVTTTDAAIAAAKQEAADMAAGQQGAAAGTAEHISKSGQELARPLTLCQRIAVRAVLAVFRYRGQQVWEGDMQAARDRDVEAGVLRAHTWLTIVDPYSLTGSESGNVGIMPWTSVVAAQHLDMPEMLEACKERCEGGQLHFPPCTMTVHYNLYFVAYAAKGLRGGGPNGALVKQALAAIKQVDPDAWVPRLLAGLEIADAVVQPSFMLGSKQESMAACNMLGHCWQQLDELSHSSSTFCYTQALQHLLDLWGPLQEQAYLVEREEADTSLNALTRAFNIGNLMKEFPNLLQHPVVLDAVRQGASKNSQVRKQLKALRAHVLVLTVLARATFNLPPVDTHWQHWQGSDAVKLLGASNAMSTAVQLAKHTHDHSKGALEIATKLSNECRGAQQRQFARLEGALQDLWLHRARWQWQIGQAAAALSELKLCLPLLVPRCSSYRLAEVLHFLQAEVAGNSAASEVDTVLSHAQHIAQELQQPGGDQWMMRQRLLPTLLVQHMQYRQMEGMRLRLCGMLATADGSAVQVVERECKRVEKELVVMKKTLDATTILFAQACGKPQDQLSRATADATYSNDCDSQPATSGGPPEVLVSMEECKYSMHRGKQFVDGTSDQGAVAQSEAASSQQQPATEPVAGGRDSGRVSTGQGFPCTSQSGSDGAANQPSTNATVCSDSNDDTQLKGRLCAQCGVASTHLKRCAGCGKVRYCGSACQRLHWQAEHQATCSRSLLAVTDANDRKQ